MPLAVDSDLVHATPTFHIVSAPTTSSSMTSMAVMGSMRWAAQALTLDAALAEVVRAMHQRGIRPLLIKGPAVAHWLYDDPGERTYEDLDLLVAPEQFGAAGAALAELGFRDTGRRLLAHERSPNEAMWVRDREHLVIVDLHHWLYLLRAPAERVWAALTTGSGTRRVAGVSVDTPSPAAHLVILVQHAAQHGAGTPKPLEDLRRAIARVEVATWQRAAALATELGASGTMREGLALVSGGNELADRLALATDAARIVRLRAAGAPDTSAGFERLLATRGVRGRVRLIGGELAPSPSFMRLWKPLARRGRLGLALAYAWRPWWLAAKLPAGARAWAEAAVPGPRRARLGPFLRGAWWGRALGSLPRRASRWRRRRKGRLAAGTARRAARGRERDRASARAPAGELLGALAGPATLACGVWPSVGRSDRSARPGGPIRCPCLARGRPASGR